MLTLGRRNLLATTAVVIGVSIADRGFAADKIELRLRPRATRDRSARRCADREFRARPSPIFATFEPHWDGTLFKQGTELEAIARGNLEMSIASAQELANFIPGVLGLHGRLSAPRRRPPGGGVRRRLHAAVQGQGRRRAWREAADGHVSRPPPDQPADRTRKSRRRPIWPASSCACRGTDAWQFLGKALGANPVPMAFAELYTALQTGAIDGQDNPLPTVMDAKFYEVTKQIVLTCTSSI